MKIEYCIDLYAMEVKRQLDVLNQNLATREYLAGADYTIADIATYPWYGALAKGLLYGAGTFLEVESYQHVQRWAQQINDRTPVKRGSRVNRPWGEESQQVRERHSAADIS
jgi:GST-like protein